MKKKHCHEYLGILLSYHSEFIFNLLKALFQTKLHEDFIIYSSLVNIKKYKQNKLVNVL